MTKPLIQIKKLSASYGRGRKKVNALQKVDLEIDSGEIFGLLGPNGAGKTTLLSCLEGLKIPDEGSLLVDGLDVTHRAAEVKQMLGLQLQRTALLDDLTVAELVQVYAGLYNVFLRPAQVDALLQRFELVEAKGGNPLASRLGRRLSGGQQQKLALALAVANDPRIVLLDEPTSALDPHARRTVWELIRQMHQEGRTVLLTTHSMEEAEALCGRVAIIDQGQIIACDTPAHLIAALDASPVLKTSLELPLDQVQPLPGVRSARYAGQYLEIETTQPQNTLAALQMLALQMGCSLGDVMLRQPNLEDVFLRLTGKTL